MTLVTVPLFSTVLPPLFDYPNHLARLYLLMEGGNAFYAVRWEPLPNLAQDLIVPPLAGLMPLDSRLETVPGHGFRSDRWWSDLAEPRCHRRVARLVATCLSAALQPDFSVGLCQLPVRDRRRAGRHGIVARSRTEAIVGAGCSPRRLWRSSAISVTLLLLGFMRWLSSGLRLVQP